MKKRFRSKRYGAGLYYIMCASGRVYTLSLVEKVEGLMDTNWVWVNQMGGDGGNDHYPTKREALAALLDYDAHRHYDPKYGWVYKPEGSSE